MFLVDMGIATRIKHAGDGDTPSPGYENFLIFRALLCHLFDNK